MILCPFEGIHSAKLVPAMSSEPLPPRSNGGSSNRFRRRFDNLGASPITTTTKSQIPGKSDRTHQVSQPTQQRRPKAEIEDKIDAAIAKRKQQVRGRGSAIFDDARQIRDVADTIVGQYEYLDHTADIQLHAWGKSLSEAMENTALAMFGYMTDLRDIHEAESVELPAVHGHDVQSIVFCFLQEWLSVFHETGFIPRKVHVDRVDVEAPSEVPTAGQERWTLHSVGRGELYDPSIHVPGTEVKAVTYSNLQVVQRSQNEGSTGGKGGDRFDIWVIVDI
jgi:SHS2 domain-containing protein